MGRKRKTVVQEHHISYNPEVTAIVYKGEHWVLTQLQRRKRVSTGLLKALKVFVALREGSAVELKK